jgi:hypothetical protein
LIDIASINGYICAPKIEVEKAKFLKNIDRGVEQLVARRAHNPKVVGSSPAPATNNTEEILIDIAQLGFFRLIPLHRTLLT